MLQLKEYVSVSSPEEALALNRKRNNVILGGCGWLRQQRRSFGTGIDLSGLGLNGIIEEEDRFRVGCMVSLRQLETHEGLEQLTGGALRESLRHIVGVQFRSCATVGGTVWGRFGFSDPLTCLLAMGVSVRLCGAGELSLEEFISMKPDRDVLLEVLIPKSVGRTVYTSFRNTETDFPVLTCALTKTADGFRCAIGARPGRARLLTAGTVDELRAQAAELPYESNLRASADYRRQLADVLLRRCEKGMEGTV